MLNRCCCRSKRGLALLLCVLQIAALCALALFGSASLAGCSANNRIEKMPFVEPAYPPLQHRLRASLYFAQADESLSAEVRLIDLDQSESPENGLVKQLIAGPTGNLLPVISDGAVLNYCYIVDDTAYVDLSMAKQQSLALFSSACVQSLHNAFGTSYLALTVDGQKPGNAQNGIVSAIPQKDESSCYVQLFFPDKRGQYVIPAVRHITKPANASMAKSIFSALQDGPTRTDLLFAIDPDSVTLSSEKQTGTGMDLYLKAEPNSIPLYGYACLAMSMLRNVPKVNLVRINVNGEWIHDVPGMAGEQGFTAASVKDIVGGLIKLYFAGADGKSLMQISRSVSFKEAADPLTPIKEIIRGPLDVEKTGIMNVLPPGVKTSDLVSLQRSESMAILDLKPSFYQSCSTLTEEAERLLLYAIVNSLTERAKISSVLFLQNGANTDTLSGTISLSKPLLRNPGIIIQP